jgi:O-antigen/teichoic acid export membrane protein
MTLARSISVQWLATIYVAAVSMLITFFLARSFGPEVFGRYSYIITLAALFAILQDGGFRTLLFREFTSMPLSLKTQKLFPSALGHLLMVTGLGIFITVLFPIQDKRYLILAISAFGLGTVANFISSVLKGNGDFDREASWRVVVRSLTAVGVIGFLFLLNFQLKWIFIGWITGFLIAIIFQRSVSLKNVLIGKPDSKTYRSIAALLTIEIATLIYFKIDIVMLRHLGESLDEVGFYAAASRILEGVIFILLPIANVFFRELRLNANHPKKFIQLTIKLMFYAGGLTLIIVPLGVLLGGDIIKLCFGADYQPGSQVIFWLLLALFFMIPNIVLTQAALAIDRENHYALGAVSAALLNIALNIWLIPIYGPEGAAIGTLITEAFLLIFIGSGITVWYLRGRKTEGESR